MTSKNEIRFYDKTTLFIIFCVVLIYAIMSRIGPPPTLDGQLFYTGEDARLLLSTFTELENASYFKNEIVDLFLILAYSSLFCFSLLKKFPQKKWVLFFGLVPGLLDLVETSLILYALKFGESFDFFNWLGIVTFFKWCSGLIVFFAIIFLYRNRSSST